MGGICLVKQCCLLQILLGALRVKGTKSKHHSVYDCLLLHIVSKLSIMI